MSIEASNARGVAIALEFLKALRPGGPWLLWAMKPEGGSNDGLFTTSLSEAEDWIDLRQSKMNMYVHVNRVDKKPHRSKALKSDISRVDYLHVDLDPPKGLRPDDPAYGAARAAILERLQSYVPSPTFIVDSGNGFNAYWRLEKPIDLDGKPEGIEAAEIFNLGLSQALGGDNCHNVDRVLRLPGTLNLPTETKRKRGCQIVRSVLSHKGDGAFSLAVFPRGAVAELVGIAQHYNLPADADGSEPDLETLLPDTEQSQVKRIIFMGDNPDEPYTDRSDLVFWVACELIRRKVSQDNIARLLMWRREPGRSKVTDHIYAQGNPRGYTARQIERATARVEIDAEDYNIAEDEKGRKKILPTQKNVAIWLNKHGIELENDVWAGRLRVHRHARFNELDDVAMRGLWLEMKGMESPAFPVGKELCYDYLQDIADKNRVHPVENYLVNQVWDGKPRVATWLSTYAGATETEYTSAVGSLVLEAAARRILEPGCKFDEMLVLESEEGLGKSSMLRALAFKSEWFTDHVPLGDEAQRVLEAIEGHWIIEVGELATLRKAEVERVKAQLSAREDKARKAYARVATTRPRQCVFVGTTNADDYLKGSTGNRRFWPVKVVRQCDVIAMKRDRDQLWAEAVQLARRRMAAEEETRLDPSMYELAKREQEGRTERDAWEDELGCYLDGITEGKVLSADLYTLLNIEPKDRGKGADATRIVNCMKRLGWSRNSANTVSIGGRMLSGWQKGGRGARLYTYGELQARHSRASAVVTPFG